MRENHRYPHAAFAPYNSTIFYLRRPWVIAWWSAAFPGMGHICLGSKLRGLLIMLWELFINVKANLNIAIIYSFTGQFQSAKEILDIRWLLLYTPFYLYTIWSSYTLTIMLNHAAAIAICRPPVLFPIFHNSLEVNVWDKRSPLLAAIWSAMMPGTGHLYGNKLVTGFFLLLFWISAAYYSSLLPAIHFTLLGAFDQVKAVVNPEWLLFMPSVHLFSIYDSTCHVAEANRLIEQEQDDFFKNHYQPAHFRLPV